jgi:ubiquitin-conjugating enzyme E2 T
MNMQSREYKYNRLVFDQRAQAMTEKYAKPGANIGSCSTQYIQSDTNSSPMVAFVWLFSQIIFEKSGSF